MSINLHPEVTSRKAGRQGNAVDLTPDQETHAVNVAVAELVRAARVEEYRRQVEVYGRIEDVQLCLKRSLLSVGEVEPVSAVIARQQGNGSIKRQGMNRAKELLA